ncbi:MAG: hypothetical protein KIS78_05880 [Labilithrix sp.]|nr:hypothetical protein [Labilithrix sp.]
MRALIVAALAFAACGGPAGSFPSSASACRLYARGADVAGAVCVASATAHVVALRVDRQGQPVVVGTFAGRLELDPSRAIATAGVAQPFVAGFDASLRPRFVTPLDLPGAMGGVTVGARGVAIVSSSLDAPEGPFLTRLGPNGEVTLRKDLGFGGLVGSVSFDPRGALLMRTQREGLRIVATDEDGTVLVAPRIVPPWIPQLPASAREGAVVSDVAVLPDGIVTAHAGEAGDEMLTKVTTTGAVVWSKAAFIDSRSQLAAIGSGMVVLNADGASQCNGRGFAVTMLDRDANPRWSKCFFGRAERLRLAADDGRVVVAGEAQGSMDFGQGAVPAPGKAGSFVLRLDESGNLRRVIWLGGPSHVANDAVAILPNGRILVAGGVGESPSQTHLYLATLKD